jgi:putative transposase
MCEALGVSRSGYYARASRPESVQAAADRSLAAEIRIAHKNSRSRYGSPRVHATLRAHGRPVARKRVACLMRGMGLSARRMVRPWSAQALRHVGPEEAGRCDALVENLRPRQLDRPDLSARFSGYGQDGPTFPGNPRPVGWRANIRGAQPPSTEHRAIREKDAT